MLWQSDGRARLQNMENAIQRTPGPAESLWVLFYKSLSFEDVWAEHASKMWRMISKVPPELRDDHHTSITIASGVANKEVVGRAGGLSWNSLGENSLGSLS